MKVEVHGVIRKNIIETTGTGDTFMGNCLYFILEKNQDGLNGYKLTYLTVYTLTIVQAIDTFNRIQKKNKLCQIYLG